MLHIFLIGKNGDVCVLEQEYNGTGPYAAIIREIVFCAHVYSSCYQKWQPYFPISVSKWQAGIV
jgi:hypothetical protein